MSSSTPDQISVLGATGSIGTSTLDVVARNPDKYLVYALSAENRIAELAELAKQHQPQILVVPEGRQDELQACLGDECAAQILTGIEGLKAMASADEVDTVMAAIVGAAGLVPTLAAVEAGKKVLLANKEALVMAGSFFMQAVQDNNAVLLPIDSEHNAIFQSMPASFQADTQQGFESVGVRKILLTASGGPFRRSALAELEQVTPDQACAHPNWSMGRKISVDSATMMNKGLELIEACWLFDCTPEQIEVVIHPQSVIHSMVDYIDGSVLAQMGNPDMRTPIAHAMAWPQRMDSGVSALDLIATGRLDFEAPDEQRFPCLALAKQAFNRGGTAMAVLNAANEIAVEAFLNARIGFMDIAKINAQVLQTQKIIEPKCLDEVITADSEARVLAQQLVAELN